jgi:hypothetical protein
MMPIKKFLRTHMEAVLISFSTIFLVIIGVFLYNTIEIVVTQSARAIATPAQQNGTGFDLQDAAKINFKGTLGNSSTTATGTGIGSGAATQ